MKKDSTSLCLDFKKVKICFLDNGSTNIQFFHDEKIKEINVHDHSPTEALECLIDWCYSVASSEEELEAYNKAIRTHIGQYLIDVNMMHKLVASVEAHLLSSQIQRAEEMGSLVQLGSKAKIKPSNNGKIH
jgi:hypothetical protein